MADDFDDRIWTPAAREELRAKLDDLYSEDMRAVLDALLDQDDPRYLTAVLRGAVFGLSARRADQQRKKG